jgi:hypothetical protein
MTGFFRRKLIIIFASALKSSMASFLAFFVKVLFLSGPETWIQRPIKAPKEVYKAAASAAGIYQASAFRVILAVKLSPQTANSASESGIVLVWHITFRLFMTYGRLHVSRIAVSSCLI